MKITEFEWDEWNTEHMAKHAVSCEETEEACYHRPLIKKSKDGRHLVYGQTYAGRYLLIVIRYKFKGLVRVITARDMTQSEQRFFLHRR